MRSILGCFESWVTWSLSHSSRSLPQGWLQPGCLVHLHTRTDSTSECESTAIVKSFFTVLNLTTQYSS